MESSVEGYSCCVIIACNITLRLKASLCVRIHAVCQSAVTEFSLVFCVQIFVRPPDDSRCPHILLLCYFCFTSRLLTSELTKQLSAKSVSDIGT